MELARYLNVLWWFYKHTFKHQKKKILFILRLQSTLKISITLSHTLILSQAAPNPERKIEF